MAVDPSNRALPMIETMAYPTAAGNMRRDRDCLQVGQPCVRLIQWPQASVTYPDTRPVTADWRGLDHSDRPTGGGILLHSPGSLVMAMVIPLSGKASFKAYLGMVQDWVMGVLASQGIPVERGGGDGGDIAYCTTYHTPYELRLNHEKVLALAVKKNRASCLIQGIIHTVSNEGFFDGWGSAMTKGLHESGVPSHTLNQAFYGDMPALLARVYTP